MSEFEFVAALTLVFVVAAALLVVAGRLSISPVPFYLLAGIVVGAFVDEGQLLDLAQWGIAFLVFAFAVELELFEGGRIEADGVAVSIVQLAVTGAATYGIGRLLGLGTLGSVYFAIAATFGSSLVALSLLERRIRLRSAHERLAETIHFVEDGVAVVVVLLLSAFVYADGGAVTLLAGASLLGGALVVRQYAFGYFAAFAEGDVEILMLTGVSLIVGFVALAELSGVSIVVGAFAAGVAVDSTYPHDVEVVDAIGYLEDFFAPVFFVTIGALVSIPTLGTLGIGAVLILAVLVVNPLVTYAVLRWRGHDPRTSLLTGYNLDQVSEFSLIIAIEALAAAALAPELFDAIVLAALVTMFASPFTSRYADASYRRLVDAGLLEPDLDDLRARSRIPADLEDHVVIAGYDREGQQVVEACESVDRPYVVVESDPSRYELVRERCDSYVFGDVAAESTWQVARADAAALLVATVPRRSWTERILSFGAGADTVVRATDVESGAALLEQGALVVSIPDVLASERLSDHVAALLEGDVSPKDLREQSRERLDRAVEYGPSDVGRIR